MKYYHYISIFLAATFVYAIISCASSYDASNVHHSFGFGNTVNTLTPDSTTSNSHTK